MAESRRPVVDPVAWAQTILLEGESAERDPREILTDWEKRPTAIVLLADETRIKYDETQFIVLSMVRTRGPKALEFLHNFRPMIETPGLSRPIKGKNLFASRPSNSAAHRDLAAFVLNWLSASTERVVSFVAPSAALPQSDLHVRNGPITKMKQQELNLLLRSIAFMVKDMDALELLDAVVDRSAQFGSDDQRLHLRPDEFAAMHVPDFEGRLDLRLLWSGDDEPTFGDLLVLPDSDAYLTRRDPKLRTICSESMTRPLAWNRATGKRAALPDLAAPRGAASGLRKGPDR